MRTVVYEGQTWDVSDQDTIQNLGQFEGEPVEILYWYDAMLNGMLESVGCGDECEELAHDPTHICEVAGDMFEITEEDRNAVREAFGVLLDPAIRQCALRYSDQGFVHLEYDIPIPVADPDPLQNRVVADVAKSLTEAVLGAPFDINEARLGKSVDFIILERYKAYRRYRAESECVDAREGDLRVWHIPNPPHEGFRFPARDLESAIAILNLLANEDLKEDDSGDIEANAQGLEVLRNGEWEEWDDEDGHAVDHYCELVRDADKSK